VTANLNQLRSRLEHKRRRLIEELNLKLSQGIDDGREGGIFSKREEAGEESLELEQRLTLLQLAREQLVEVEHALKKFEKGTYGLCDRCGEPISLARLEALPQSNLCVDCKAHQAGDAKGRSSPVVSFRRRFSAWEPDGDNPS